MERAISFGYKSAWLAVRASDPRAVAEALEVRDVERMGWAEGLRRAYDFDSGIYKDTVFVTPPVQGWVLCVGGTLLDLVDEEPAFPALLVGLARRLDSEVQFFATHRIVEAHAWGRADPGGLRRAFCYIGERGEICLDKGVAAPGERCTEAETPDEQSVMHLAAAWSVDPSALEERSLEVPEGLSGVIQIIPFVRPARTAAPPAAQAPVNSSDEPQSPAPAKPWWRFW